MRYIISSDRNQTVTSPYRTNFIDSGVAIIDAARNLDETIADAAKGLAGAIDAVFMEDRNPAEIYRDLNEQFDIVIEDFNTLSPADQQEVLGRIQGNLLAEGTKIIVGGAAGSLRTGDVIKAATRILKDETGALTLGKGRRRNNGGDGINNGTTTIIGGDIPVVRVDVDNVRRGTPEYDILNNPPPNTSIEVSNGNVYITNANGFVDEVSFQPRLVKEPRDARQTAAGKEGLDTDVGGHIQACSLGGTCDRVNLFPQDANFNNSAYKKFENIIRDALDEGKDVGPVKVKFMRNDPNNPRPDRVIVEYTIDGETARIPFRNQNGG